MILADVVEKFGTVSMEKDRFVVDPAQYFSAPQMAWDRMLKKTGSELQLITNTALYHMFECGMRGGVCVIGKRYGKANNKLIGNFDPARPERWIIYNEANNLYAWAMSQYLPFGDFNCLEEATFNQIDWQAQREEQAFETSWNATCSTCSICTICTTTIQWNESDSTSKGISSQTPKSTYLATLSGPHQDQLQASP